MGRDGQAEQSGKPKNDPFDEIAAVSIGEFLGNSVAAAAEGLASFKQNSADVSREGDAARKAFWVQYPNGSRRAQAEAEFARKLYVKDFEGFDFYIDERVAHPQLTATLVELAAGEPPDAAGAALGVSGPHAIPSPWPL